MANARRTITVYPTLAALGTDIGQSLARYATALDSPRIYQWLPGDTSTVDDITVLGYSGGIAGAWKYVRDYDRGTNLTDAAETLYVSGDVHRVLLTAVLTADRAKTLGTTQAVAGDHVFITSQDNSSFLLSVVNGGAGAGTLLTIRGPGWGDCEFDGANWFVRSYGGGANAGANVGAQAAWYINGTTGLDSNAGSVSAPLKTIAEFSRRIAGVRLNTGGNIYVYCQTAFVERVDLKILLGDATILWFIGTRSAAVISGTLTSGTRNWDETTQQDGRVIDSALATSWTSSLTDVKKLIKVDIGGGLFGESWIGYDLASKTARISEPFDMTNGVGVSIASGQTYTVHTMSQFGTYVTVNVTAGHGSAVFFQDLEIGTAGTHSTTFKGDGGIQLFTCKVHGLDVDGIGWGVFQTYGCCTVAGYRTHAAAIVDSYSSLHYGSTLSNAGSVLKLSNAYLENGGLTADIGAAAVVPTGAWLAIYNPGLGVGGDGLQALHRATITIKGRAFGTCESTGYGAFAEVGAHIAYLSTKPIAITGGTADTIIGGTTKSYATLSTAGYFDTATGAGIVGTSFARS